MHVVKYCAHSDAHKQVTATPMLLTQTQMEGRDRAWHPSFGEAGAFLGSAQATASSHNGRCLRLEPFPNGTWVVKEAVHFHRRPVFSRVSAISTLSEQVSGHVYVLHPASHAVKATPILSRPAVLSAMPVPFPSTKHTLQISPPPISTFRQHLKPLTWGGFYFPGVQCPEIPICIYPNSQGSIFGS